MLRTVVMVGVFGGEHPSSPPLTSPWCVIVVLNVVRVMLFAGGEQGSATPSPMKYRSAMMFIANTMRCSVHVLYGVVLVRLVFRYV